MTPYYSDDHLTLYGGDCRAVMASMSERSVHTVVTSPPYWGLRDYGTATWDGGDPACDHLLDAETARRQNTARSTLGGGKATQIAAAEGRHRCRCGAIRQDSQLGLEATPEAYVANMVAVFREVRRVLRDDGTLWLNLGDSYAAGGGSGEQRLDELGARLGTGGGKKHSSRPSGRAPLGGLKPKDLVGIPWRVAFALQADGWYLRSDIIWSKPNPMPESVTDRPTKAHEYLFLLSKAPRYWYDADAVREADSGQDHRRAVLDGQPSLEPSGGVLGPHTGLRTIEGRNGSGRNLRSVWTIATEPYPGAHFATFPRKLVEPCVKAGSPEGGTVLDPFAGSGTTLLVAQALGRRGVGIDLNPDYLKQALARNAQTPLGLVG